jgi:lipopolysaccharide export LptBFGC system permease protein LptF
MQRRSTLITRYVFLQNKIAAGQKDLPHFFIYGAHRLRAAPLNACGPQPPPAVQRVRYISCQWPCPARARWAEHLSKWTFENGWQRSWTSAPGEDLQEDFRKEDLRKFDVSTFAELNEPPPYFKKEVLQSSEMNYDELRRYLYDLQQGGFDVVRLRVQLQKKIAFPLITLVMAMLAVPFALSGGRRGALSGVVVALVIGVTYVLTSSLFEAMGNVSQLPPLIAAWSPDLTFGLAGGYLIMKTSS